MYLKVALIEVAIDGGFISEEDALFVYAEIQTLTAPEVATRVNISPLSDDDPTLSAAIDGAIANNERAVADYLAGKDKAINKVMGQVMGTAGGRNDAEAVLSAIKRKVDPATEEIEREVVPFAKACANWIIGDLMAKMNANGFEFETRPKMISRGKRGGCPLSPETLAEFIGLIKDGRLSHGIAHQRVFPRMWDEAMADREKTLALIDMIIGWVKEREDADKTR